MNILIVYATNSGTTMTAAGSVQQALEQAGHTVTQKLVNEATVEEFGTHDLVIFGSPSWDFDGREGEPHEDFVKFIQGAAGKTAEGKKFAIFGLGDRSYTHFCGAVDHLEKFVADLKGVLATASLRIDNYYQNLPANEQAITAWVQTLLSVLK